MPTRAPTCSAGWVYLNIKKKNLYFRVKLNRVGKLVRFRLNSYIHKRNCKKFIYLCFAKGNLFIYMGQRNRQPQELSDWLLIFSVWHACILLGKVRRELTHDHMVQYLGRKVHYIQFIVVQNGRLPKKEIRENPFFFLSNENSQTETRGYNANCHRLS